MKKLNTAILIGLSIYCGSVMAQNQGMNKMKAMMKHANPAPNYMQVVKRNADLLDLTEQQLSALAAWRKQNHNKMHGMVHEIHELEKAIFAASMSGKSKDEIMDLTDKALELRKKVISGKTDCRDNMKSILSAEQFSEVIKIYQGS